MEKLSNFALRVCGLSDSLLIPNGGGILLLEGIYQIRLQRVAGQIELQSEYTKKKGIEQGACRLRLI